MSKEQLNAFETAVRADAGLQDEIEQLGDDLAAIVAVGQREGFAFTESELANYMANYQPDIGRELSDQELANVAGAGWTSDCTHGSTCEPS